jgi:hypothetical protein
MLAGAPEYWHQVVREGKENHSALKAKLELERGAAAKTENQDQYNGKENRHYDREGTAGS